MYAMTAKHTERQNQGVSPSRSPAFQFYADDWLAGTMGLSYEAKGFYIDLLALMWSRKGAIPLDQVGAAFRLDPRVATRLVNLLIDAGKVSLDADNRIYNERMNASLEVTYRRSSAAQSRGKVAAKSDGLSSEVQAKLPPKNPETQDISTVEASTKNAPSPSPIRKKEESTNVLSASAGPNAVRPIDVLEAFQKWGQMALRAGLPQPRNLTPDLKRKIGARIRENGPESWDQALAAIERSQFCRGGADGAGWRMDLHSLVKPEKFAKALSGAYGNGAHADVPDIAAHRAREAEVDRLMADLDAEIGRH